MTLTYAGGTLALGDLGADTVDAFVNAGQAQNQVSAPLRSPWAAPYDRQGRLHTISFRLNFGAEAQTGDMLAKQTTFFSSLPGSGDLVWEEDGRTLKCAAAVLQGFTPENRVGVSASATLTFLGGAIVEVTE